MYQHILVPVDGSPTSNAGLAEAVKLARLTGAKLRLMHVVDPVPMAVSAEGLGMLSVDVRSLLRETGEQVLARARAQVESAGIAVDTVLLEGDSGRLCDLVARQVIAWPADLIVIGTHGRRGIGRIMMGSDAEQILRHATVPVLLYRCAAQAPSDPGAA